MCIIVYMYIYIYIDLARPITYDSQIPQSSTFIYITTIVNSDIDLTDMYIILLYSFI